MNIAWKFIDNKQSISVTEIINNYIFATKNVVDNYQRRTAKTIATTSVSEAESKEKHGVWDPMPELTITSPYVQSRLQHIYRLQPYARVYLNPMPESTLFPSHGLDFASGVLLKVLKWKKNSNKVNSMDKTNILLNDNDNGYDNSKSMML